MTGLGAIGLNVKRSNQLHEMRLANAVMTVDRTEAEQGAQHNDLVRLTRREREDSVPLERYLSRVRQSTLLLKKNSEHKKKDETEESCPIKKARAQSEVGENAPLGWLVADQMGGQAEVPQKKDMVAPEFDLSTSEPAASFAPAETVAQQGGSLLDQEWLLTPCA